MGAIAIGHPQANAVGPVRLTCKPRELEIELLRVGRFSEGFAFAGLADGTTFRVPYRAVRGMVERGRTLHLSLDPHVATPYNRFALVRFSSDPNAALMRAYRWHGLARGFGWLLAPAVAALGAWQVPGALAGGAGGRLAVGLVVLVALFKLWRWVVDRVTWGGPASDRHRAAFERAVSARLGLEVSPDVGPVRLDPPSPSPVHLLGGAARARAFGAVVALALVGATATILTVRRFGVQTQREVALIEARRGLDRPIRGVVGAAVEAGTPDHERCSCGRPYVGLWSQGFPELSIVLSPVVGQIDALWVDLGDTVDVTPGEDDEVELDLAIVNNGERTFDTIDLVATFARRDAEGRRRDLRERGMHWPGKLRPGESIKWRLEAAGTEVKVQGDYQQRLGAGVEPASPEALHDLRDARLRLVRLHAATLLAWLGDPRGPSLAREIGALPPNGERVRREVLSSLTPLRLCDARPVRGGLEACVYNGTDRLHRALIVRDGGGEVLAELRDLFVPGEGLRFVLEVEPDAWPERLEVVSRGE